MVAAAAPGTLVAGARVDVLVTRDRGAGAGGTEPALEDVDVLASRPVPEGDGECRGSRSVAATLARQVLCDAI